MTRQEFMDLAHWWHRLTMEETSWIIGCQTYHIPLLVKGKYLFPLGNPAPNAEKFFHLADVLEFAADRKKMARASDYLAKIWRERNEAARAKRNTTSP